MVPCRPTRIADMTEVQTFDRYSAHLRDCSACRYGAPKGALCRTGFRLHGQWKQAEERGRRETERARGRRVA